MPGVYKHTQIGYLTLSFIGVAILVTGTTMFSSPHIIGVVVLVVLIVVAVLFASLTIEIRDGAVRAAFGPGLIHKTVPLGDIERCETLRYPWYYGWGIRFTPQGVLYNVSGLQAVKLVLKSGHAVLLGTDEPEKLCSAIRGALYQ
ncbi:MAG: hypothetical protein HC884_05530 [Chloroflexaceae bacterium]|nr:hypothetical protein [Chloroflexaceae bacterium]